MLRQYTNIISGIGVMVILFIFFSKFSSLNENTPYMLDDSKTILGKTNELLNSSEKDYLSFLLGHTNWPHPKLIGKSLILIQATVFEEINFKTLKYFGIIFLILSLFYYYYSLGIKNLIFCLPLLLFGLAPIEAHYWTLPILGFPFLYFLAFKASQFIEDGKVLYAGLILPIITFTHSPGFAFILIGYLFILLKKELIKTKLTNFIIWTISSLFSVGLYYKEILSIKDNVGPRNDTSFIPSSFDEIQSLVLYFSKLLFQPITLNQRLTANSFIILFYTLLAIVIISIIYSIKKKINWKNEYLAFSSFCLLILIITTLMNDKRTTLADVPFSRYLMYSSFFWVALSMYFLQFKNLKKEIRYLSLFTLIALGIFYNINANKRIDKYLLKSKYSIPHRFSGNASSELREPKYLEQEEKIIAASLESGLYSHHSVIKQRQNAIDSSESSNLKAQIGNCIQSDVYYLIEWLVNYQNQEKDLYLYIKTENGKSYNIQPTVYPGAVLKVFNKFNRAILKRATNRTGFQILISKKTIENSPIVDAKIIEQLGSQTYFIKDCNCLLNDTDDADKSN